MVGNKVKKQEDKHPSIIPGNKDQLPGDAFGAIPEASNNKKKSPQHCNPALNSNFRKIQNNNIKEAPWEGASQNYQLILCFNPVELPGG